MRAKIMELALIVGAVIGVAVAATPAHAGSFYPNRGDLYYDGEYYADSFFGWTEPEWMYTYAGFEMDLSLDEFYFDSCTSWTDLPDPYDDCPTAGYSDPEGKKNFGIGSFAAESILPISQKTYVGRWYFAGGYGISTHVNVTAQEVSRTLCPEKSIWCYIGVQGTSLKETVWEFLVTNYVTWDYIVPPSDPTY